MFQSDWSYQNSDVLGNKYLQFTKLFKTAHCLGKLELLDVLKCRQKGSWYRLFPDLKKFLKIL